MPANLLEDRIPQDLIRRDGWQCWKSQPRNGKFTKKPINPHTDSFNLNRSARSSRLRLQKSSRPFRRRRFSMPCKHSG
jgi:16S rRNA C1402 N4-methylase RsmH